MCSVLVFTNTNVDIGVSGCLWGDERIFGTVRHSIQEISIHIQQ
jgi:hypothetical protein